MRWVLTLLMLVFQHSSAQIETCLSAEDEPYLYLGTNTAYDLLASNTNSRIHEIVGCQPVAFWSLNRPGSHNPEANEIPNLHQLETLRSSVLINYRDKTYQNSNQRICAADVTLLERWQWNPRHNATFAGDLTSDGYIGTQHLAQTWKQKFPTIFTDNRKDYLFRYSKEERSRTSFQAFIEGLFRAQAEGFGIPQENEEKLLKPYKFCPAWTRDVEENNETLAQRRIFESKQEFKEMISNISKRLGFNYDIDRSTVYRMYQMCGYNKAWAIAQISPWCSAFNHEDLKRLEYAEDLETYYKYGYGSKVNQKVGCSLVKDMMDYLTKHVESTLPQQPRTVVSYTDAGQLLMVLSTLGARRDSTPLTGDNYRTPQMQSRRWTTSKMAPFNGNLAAVLYKCNSNAHVQLKDSYQVLFLENDQQMYLDGCRVGLCDWAMVKIRYGELAKNCDLQFCNKAFKSTLSLSLLLVTFLVKFLSH